MKRKKSLVILLVLIIMAVSACEVDTPQESIPLPETMGAASSIDPNIPEPSSQDNAWLRTYADDYISMGGDVIQTNDGGFLIIGSIGGDQATNLQGGVLLIRTDPNGEVLWQRVYGGAEYDAGWKVLEAADGNFILAGETASFGEGGLDGYLIKVDQEGNEIWSHTYGTPLNETITSVALTPDGGYYLVGNSVNPADIVADPGAAGYGGYAGRSNIYIVRIDSEGNELWSQIIESDNNVIAFAGLSVPDGGLVILSTIMFFPDLNNELYLLRLGDNGQTIWSRVLDDGSFSGYAMIPSSDGCFIITGTYANPESWGTDVFLLKVDMDGNELWRTIYGDPARYEDGVSIIETLEDTYLVLTSSTYSLYAGEAEVDLLFFDMDGDYLRTEQVNSGYGIKAQAILQLADGSYVITGSTINSSLNTYQVVLIKTDDRSQ
jgi:hypothetical protein